MKGLIKKEILVFTSSSAFYLLIIIASFLIGSSFITSIDLYSKASVAALKDPIYARSFEPVPGVFVPAFGGFYLVFSLLLPFAVIPMISREFEYNTISLLPQLGYGMGKILIQKFFVSLGYVLLTLSLSTPAIIFWITVGGHVAWAEMALLLAGYVLYGILVISISFASASILKSTSSASILALTIVLSSWVLDFMKDATASPLILYLSKFTFTSLLRVFEKGIFSAGVLVKLAILSGTFLVIAYFMMEFFKRKNALRATLTLIIGLILLFASGFIGYRADITESYRNSFPPAVRAALRKLPPLEIDIHLRKSDSRLVDYRREFLDRLLLVKRDVKVVFPDSGTYGLFVYRVKNNSTWISDSTFSNSPEEAFSIISTLSGIKIPQPDVTDYPGYPLVVERERLWYLKFVYYLLLPLLGLAIWIKRRIP